MKIKELQIECIIGILDFERENSQKVVVNLECDYEYGDKFLDYALIVSKIEDSFICEQFLLIEDAINSILTMLKKEFSFIKSIKIEILKPDILKNCTVGIEYFMSFD
ncbi:MAG: dihydroneopterin aldolase [Campylobacterales bacterium]|nr:dihydroneopterin aldolase [Campylobacterales bacterium]